MSTSVSTLTAYEPQYQVKYLEHFTKALSKKISYMDTQSASGSVASVVTFVAFTALAVCGFVATGIFMPVYLPIASIAALVCANPAADFVKGCLVYSESHKQQADQLRKIETNYSQLAKLTTAQIQENLSNREISWLNIPNAQPENLALLNPLLARAQFLDDKIQEKLQMKDQLRAEAHQLEVTNALENRSKIYDLRHTALSCEDTALRTKIEAAFVNAVLRKGILIDPLQDLEGFNKSLENIASLSKTAYHERILGNELQDPTVVNQFLTFRNSSLAPITFDDVKNLHVAELGRRLAEAII